MKKASDNQPDFIAYSVQEGVWTKIGAAWLHDKGDGHNLTLNALPPASSDGKIRIVLRANEKPSALPVDGHAPARASNPHATGGGDCPSCQGKGWRKHPVHGSQQACTACKRHDKVPE